MKQPFYQYDPETHESVCILTYKDEIFVGQAFCHPEDLDMANAKTGQTIAYLRAAIKYYQHLKNHEIKPKIEALRQFYYTVNQSKQFSPNCYEIRMLQRQIRNYEDDLVTVRCSLAQLQKNLREFVQEKEKFYNKIRNNREGTKNIQAEIKAIQDKAKSDQSN